MRRFRVRRSFRSRRGFRHRRRRPTFGRLRGGRRM